MREYKNIFLDFDDTLIDTQGFATKCLKELYDEYSLSNFFVSKDSFLEIYHRHTKKLWEDYALGSINKATLLKHRFEKPFDHAPDIIGEFTTQINDSFINKVTQIDLVIDGADDLLSYLRSKKYKIIMLSNGFTEMQYKKINNLNWDHFFDFVILSDVIGINKPNPIIFRRALEISNSKVEESIMIGDSYMADIQGAMNVNMDQIWYNPQYLQIQQRPTHMVNRLIEIMNIL